MLTLGLYTHVGLVNAAHGVSHDGLVQAWERALFGGQPSRDWIRAFPSPVWSSLMHAAYLSYYGVLVAAPLGLWLAGRRAAARATLLLTMTTFYLCYTIFLAFPVAGPRYLFAPAAQRRDGGPRRGLHPSPARRRLGVGHGVPVLARGRGARGRELRLARLAPLGMALVPAALLLSLATVYGQLHYAVDALAGDALAALVLLPAAGRVMMRAPPWTT